MFDEKNINIEVSQKTYSGYSLKSHLNSIIIGGTDGMIYTREKDTNEETPTEKLLKSDTIFDHIILQERTSLAIIDEIRNKETIPAINQIKKIVSGQPKFGYFQNFPTNQEYPKVFCNRSSFNENVCSDTIMNVNQEISMLNNAFNEIGDENSVVNIGNSFSEVILKNDDIDLYDDDSHPSKYGSYLIALNLFKYLTNQNPETLKYNAELEDKKVNVLKEIVSEMKN